ncbi:hypothetical protein [Paraclostridium dentum]|uniref:hypothetical protein n=1 Tax=Paraclostridium dentum TaxID=2662455 RepID=UPI0034643F62
MFEIINFPYNSNPVARLDANNIVHNHLYHNCPVGKVDNSIVYDNFNNIVGSIDDDGFVYSNNSNLAPIGNVDNNGFIYKENKLVGKINFKNSMCPKLAGASYLLLIHGNR